MGLAEHERRGPGPVGPPDGTPPRAACPPERPTPEAMRIRELEARVRQLEASERKLATERDILRKAAKYFRETNW
jgi:transposase